MNKTDVLRAWLRLAKKKHFVFGLHFIETRNGNELRAIVRKGPSISPRQWEPFKQKLKESGFQFSPYYSGWYHSVTEPISFYFRSLPFRSGH